jgi:hypothetical protein
LNEHRNAVLCHLIVGIQRDEHTNAPHALALLRARRERPCRCAAEKRDERAPFHCPVPPMLSTERIAHLSTAGGCCAAQGFSSVST